MLTFEPYGTSRTYGARASGTYDLSALFGVSSQPWDVEGSPHPSTYHCLDLVHCNKIMAVLLRIRPQSRWRWPGALRNFVKFAPLRGGRSH
ncbi:hypothetical protein PCANC_11400 [Puccinia coronata f. sp. avenae]|uniref:Uncharacterized protein n=1 Tax=Puccinia coronata f. sp. avenae TaxID=200324 RepID=A0A2N5VMI8_9BASI|nr:hypothetical protein PCANC_11400 [Puccinia coronata f. sp. avenae]